MTFHTFNRILQIRWVNHLIYWVLFVLIGSYIFSYQQNFPYIFYLLNLVVHLPVLMLYTYFVIYRLVPDFLLRSRYFSFFGLLVVSTVLASLLKLYVSKNVYYALFIPQALHPHEWYSFDSFLINLLWITGPTVLFAMFKYYKNWIKSQDISNETERKRLATELQVLKGQLNPHFLFNTLNNIYSLALSKSDRTAVVIEKMSDMFRFIIYECNAIEVPVSKELKLIDDYIELEQLRYSDRLSIQFKKEIDNQNHLIPPMLLYSFVENCFKHGSSPDPDEPWIKLSLHVRNNILTFEARNSIPKKPKKTHTEGVGFLNGKRRLELIYPTSHRLTVREENNEFFVRLEITKPELSFR
jgi:two-component system, LytTR family, sensor kinase